MPAAASSYLSAMGRGRRSFAYHKLKKLPPAASTATPGLELEQQDHHQRQHSPSAAAAIQESYHSYYRALGAAFVRGRRRGQWQQQRPRRVRPRRRLRISGLASALRRRAAAVGGRVRAAAAKVARRLREGRPYIGDLFAGNYMFMQVAPSPTMVAAGGLDDKSLAVPFAEYYYAKVGKGMVKPVAAPPPATAGAVMYKV
ncbi:unnamed protein product [Urochloa decumbens]|uniref:Uncharacterized protein n=1 Tax=Urochloa decumbens TaxID=240449 RepID=A0ABC9A283_9POAL